MAATSPISWYFVGRGRINRCVSVVVVEARPSLFRAAVVAAPSQALQAQLAQQKSAFDAQKQQWAAQEAARKRQEEERKKAIIDAQQRAETRLSEGRLKLALDDEKQPLRLASPRATAATTTKASSNAV